MTKSTGVTDRLAHDLAEAEGVCVRPLLRRLIDRDTGHANVVILPCGSTQASRCVPCAEKARRLRMQQCTEGWHLTDELPDKETGNPSDDQGADDSEEVGERRVRSTRRRQDAPDLPRLPIDDRTVGTSFIGREGKVFRPSMFITLTLPSYGKISPGTGVPVNPRTYDYHRAALDALLFPKVIDRWVQNLRRASGYQVQYFAAVEPQKRLAPHLHAAVRGAIPRALVKQVTAGTYHQVWWPSTDEPVYQDGDVMPVWDRDLGGYVDPITGEALRTWGDALDDLDVDPDARPMHVVRLGKQVDIQGIIAPSPDADRAVRYLTKYLAKSMTDTYDDPDDIDPARQAHLNRLHAEIRVLPCSPKCANWLRYGIQPADPGPGLTPGRCISKAHDTEHLGLGGRRVLVSRKWTGKTLDQHKADRAEIVRAVLAEAGIEMQDRDRCAADQLSDDGLPRFRWEPIDVTQADYQTVIGHALIQHRTWKAQYEQAKALAATGPPGPVDSHSATNQPAATAA
ncbi:hypothetical protein SAMN05892883_0768 [Jatrophihabitans sp. GAS493]|uniref:replication initiator n=1 Tax=Jatrophihabitans sp. GAS493 TaxID=1907575 RepID=UPI000BB6B988|nr:replication initiator [Jatrophihabitans sp. GAS493]SOD71204.1 hypothetical protein SAMN05892883_0768 [Jatrophihabitans sp. GAS493]